VKTEIFIFLLSRDKIRRIQIKTRFNLFFVERLRVGERARECVSIQCPLTFFDKNLQKSSKNLSFKLYLLLHGTFIFVSFLWIFVYLLGGLST